MKKDFYIFQEDLVNYHVDMNDVTLSDFVKDINKRFCEDGMKKLRVETINNYLLQNRFIVKDNGFYIPTAKGRLLGIRHEERINKDGYTYYVNLFSKKMLIHIIDNLYKII